MAEGFIAERLDDFTHLLEYYNSLDYTIKGWQMGHLQLSKLRPQSRGENQIRIAADAMNSILERFEGRSFIMPRGDIVLLVKGAPQSDVQKQVTRLRYLFNDDPLFAGATESDSSRFVQFFDLITEHRVAAGRARQLFNQAERDFRSISDSIKRRETGEKSPLQPRHLSEIESALEKADLSDLIRSQPIVLLQPGKGARPVFNELHVGIADLNSRLMPSVEFTSNRWLFQYLTSLLDRRVLAFLARATQPQFSRAFSLNINVASLLTPEFQAFDRRIPPESKKTILFELQAIDVYADMGAFVFARDTLQERGYRFCLDGLTHLTLPLVDRRALKIDLLKVNWSREMLDENAAAMAQAMREYVEYAGPSRVIFARCDTQESIKMGRQMGLALFQGRFLDAVLAGEAQLG